MQAWGGSWGSSASGAQNQASGGKTDEPSVPLGLWCLGLPEVEVGGTTHMKGISHPVSRWEDC